MMIELDNIEKRIILACKGHKLEFHDNMRTEIIKQIISKDCALPIEYVDLSHVTRRVIEIFFKICPDEAQNLLLGMFRWSKIIGMEDLCREVMSYIANVRVLNDDGSKIIDLDYDGREKEVSNH